MPPWRGRTHALWLALTEPKRRITCARKPCQLRKMDNFSAGDDALDHQLEGLLYSTDLSASGLSPTGEDAGVGPDLLATLGLDPNDLMGHGDEAPPPIPAPTPAPFGFPSFNAPQQTGLQQPPSPPTMAADITTSDWADLQLIINQHSVHKVEEDEVTGDKTYVVSNLRKFKIEVALVHRETQPPVAANENQLQLRVRPLSPARQPADSIARRAPARNAYCSRRPSSCIGLGVTPRGCLRMQCCSTRTAAS